MNIGNKIRELRLKKSVTQELLANYLSVTVQCVSKWENNVTTPDIQLLPRIAVFFGVSIDELFNLSEDDTIKRIEGMIENKKLMDTEEFHQAETFLRKKQRENMSDVKYPMYLSALYNHMADGYRVLAGEHAKYAIRLQPEKKYNHTLLRMAEQGSQMDWNFANRTARICYYIDFVKKYPNFERGYVCLIDELFNANRIAEAEQIVLDMDKFVHGTKSMFYIGYIAWVRNKEAEAYQLWEEMLAEVGNDWMAYALLGDCMARYCRYEEAIEYYQKSLEFQPLPRFTDSQISIAVIYEILGQTELAIEAWETVLEILRSEHGIVEGYTVEKVNDEIKRLKEAGRQI